MHYSMFIVYKCDGCGKECSQETDRYSVDGVNFICLECLKKKVEVKDE